MRMMHGRKGSRKLGWGITVSKGLAHASISMLFLMMCILQRYRRSQPDLACDCVDFESTGYENCSKRHAARRYSNCSCTTCHQKQILKLKYYAHSGAYNLAANSCEPGEALKSFVTMPHA